MNYSDFHFFIYYFGLLIAIIFLSRFIFRKYIQFAKSYNLKKSSNERAAHKGLVFTGGGVVYAAVIMVAAVILDNLDFVELSNFSPIVATAILVSILGFYDDFIDISAFNKYIVLTFLIDEKSLMIFNKSLNGTNINIAIRSFTTKSPIDKVSQEIPVP